MRQCLTSQAYCATNLPYAGTAELPRRRAHRLLCSLLRFREGGPGWITLMHDNPTKSGIRIPTYKAEKFIPSSSAESKAADATHAKRIGRIAIKTCNRSERSQACARRCGLSALSGLCEIRTTGWKSRVRKPCDSCRANRQWQITPSQDSWRNPALSDILHSLHGDHARWIQGKKFRAASRRGV